jgi:S-adenosylmethionine/arginine decarboxylase-like enzyme
MRSFVKSLESAGFTVTRDQKSGRPDVAGRPFGDQYGFTMTAILSESHAAIHTYPEEMFGVTAEIEFNLCYLNKNHMPHLKRAKQIFKDKFGAHTVRTYHGRRRYLAPP